MHRTAILKPFTTLLLLGSMLCISPAGWAQGICDRTPEVRDRIIALIPGTPDCADVTNQQLAAVTGLNLFGGITTFTLRAGDFSGLSLRHTLNIKGNDQLTTLPAGVFRGLSVTRQLDLSRNQLTTLFAGTFDGLRVHVLDLRENQLTTLPAGVFQGLSVDSRVYFDRNPGAPFSLTVELERIDAAPGALGPAMVRLRLVEGAPRAISRIPLMASGGVLSVSEATIAGGRITSAPFTVTSSGPTTVRLGTLPALPSDILGLRLASGEALVLFRTTSVCARTPQVRDKIVEQVPGVTDCADVTLQQLADISSLDLSNSNITTLQAGDFQGLVLRDLLLHNNQLRTLPAEVFDGLTLSGDIRLQDNQLRTLPAEAFDGLFAKETLRDLFLHNNQLITLPAGVFAGLTFSGGVFLYNNRLITLPTGVFQGLTVGEDLRLDDNLLTTLSAGVFEGLSLSGGMWLDNNRLRTLSSGVFEGLSFSFLRLNNNLLTDLSAGIFAGLTVGGDLRLDNNRLTDLSAGVLQGLTVGEDLRLDNNRLTDLSAGAFQDLTVGRDLKLDNNQLTTLPAGVFEELAVGRVLDLRNNPGAPFPLAVELERTDEALDTAGPATVRLRLATGAPRAIQIPLTVSAGMLSSSEATIAVGTTASDAFMVTGSGPTTVGLGTLPPLDNTFGLQLLGGDNLVLFGTADTTAPTITSATITSTPTEHPNRIISPAYGVGETIAVALAFNEAVVVDTTAGRPSLTLQVGTFTSGIRKVLYVSGGRSMTTLVFHYLVLEGDQDTTGISWRANALQLNGSTLQDRSGNDADTTVPVLDASEFLLHKVAATTDLRVSLASEPVSVNEGADAEIAVTVVADGIGSPKVPVPELPLTIHYTLGTDTSVDTADAGGADYAAGDSLEIAVSAGASSVITIPIVYDSVIESEEVFTVTLVGGPRYTVGAPSMVVVTISDRDMAPDAINLSVNPAALLEGSGLASVVVSATLGDGTLALSDALSIPLMLGGTATKDTDYTVTGPLSIEIGAGSVTGRTTLMITPIADDDAAESETIVITAELDGYSVSAAMLELFDHGRTAYTVSSELAMVTVMEDDAAIAEVEVTVAGTLPPLGPVIVPYILTDGTATAGEDYVAPELRELTFTVAELSSGTASKNISIAITDDSVYEGDEGFTVQLGTPTGAVRDSFMLGTRSSSMVTITENDQRPTGFTLEFSMGDIRLQEGEGVLESADETVLTWTINVTGSVSLAEATEFAIMVSGGSATTADYMLTGGPFRVTLPARALSASATLTLTPVQDMVAERFYADFFLRNETIEFTATVITTGTGFNTPPTAEIAIVDDDTPVLAIAAVNNMIAEGAAAQFRVTTSLALARPLLVFVQVEDSGMFLDEAAPSTVTVPAGGVDTFLLLELPTKDDAIDGADGTVTMTLQGDDLYTFADPSSEPMAVVNVADNDMHEQTVVFGATDYMATEGGTAATVTVSLRPASAGVLNIPITLGNAVDDTAETADWSVMGLQGTPGAYTLAFAENDISKTFTVTAVDDTIDESNTETLSLSFGSLPSPVGAGLPAAATLTLVDDDVPDLTITAVVAAITEGAVAQFEVTSSLALAQPLTVSVQVEDSGTFLTGSAPTTVTVPAGNAGVSAVFNVSTSDDTTDEPNGTLTATLQANAAYTISGTAGMATVSVADNDAPGVTVAFSAAAYTATEGGAAAMVMVNLSAAPGRALNIPITLGNAVDDTAETADWSVTGLQGGPGAYTLAFAESDTSKAFTVIAFDDTIDESASETLALSFGTLPVRVSAGDPAAATLTLVDDDVPALTITVVAAAITEGAEAQFEVTSSLALAQPLTVSVQVVDSGPFLTGSAPTTVVVPAGAAGVSVTFALPTEDDEIDEPNGTLTVTLQADAAYTISVGAGEATVNVEDDDAPGVTVAFSAFAYTATEGGAAAMVMVNLSAAPERSVVVPVNLMNAGAAGNSDWSVTGLQGGPGAYTLAFAGSETSQTFTVTAVDDTIDESASETLSLIFGVLPERVSEGGLASAILTLVDDDPTPTVISLRTGLMTLTEGSGSVSVVVMATLGDGMVTLPEALVIPLTLGGSATPDRDYTVIGTEPISIAIGATTGMTTLMITLTADDIAETETIEIMGTLIGYTVNSAVLTLQDQAGYTVSVPATATVAEDGATVLVAVTVTGERASIGPVTVPYTLTGDTATAGEDYTVPGTPALEFTTGELSSGTASKNISIAITEDMVYEGNETFTVQLGMPTGAVVGDSFALEDLSSSTVVTITENDTQPTAFTLTVDTTDVSESGGDTPVMVTVTVTGSVSLADATVFDLAVGGSATTADYSLSGTPGSRTVTVPAEALTGAATFTLTPTPDSIAEGNETIEFTAMESTAVTGFGALESSAMLTLTDDDVAPTMISLSTFSTTLTEGAGPEAIVVTATLQGSVTLPNDLVIPLTLGGAATKGTDYTVMGTESIRITAGATMGMTTLTITSAPDAMEETTETLDISGMLIGYTVNSAELTLQDRAGYTVSVPATATVAESSARGTVTVTVAGTLAPLGPVTVPYTLMPGTAMAEDYMVSGTSPLEFTASELSGGTASKNIRIDITDDTFYEGDETFTVELGTPTGATGDRFTLGTQSSTVTITDNDTRPTGFTLEVSPTNALESAGATTVMVRITVAGAVSLPVATVFDLAVGGSAVGADYSLSGSPGSRTVTVPEKVRIGTAEFTLTPEDDTGVEGNETIEFTATVRTADTGFATPESATFTLIDNDVMDTVSVGWQASGYTVDDGNVGDGVSVEVCAAVESGTLNAGRSVGLSYETVAGTAIAGTHYTAVAAGSLTLMGGTERVCATVAVLPDMEVNADRMFTVRLIAAEGTPATDVTATLRTVDTTVTIVNDDVTELTIMAVADTITEGAVAQFEVTSSLALAQPLVVSVQVEDSGMFLLGAAQIVETVVPAGNAGVSVVLDVPTDDDTTDESDGTVTATLQVNAAYTISAAAGVAVVNVADNDVPEVTVAFSAATYRATEGGTAAAVTVLLSAAPERTVAVPVTLVNAGAAGDSDWSVADLQGTPGAYTLEFSGSEISQTFTVTAVDDNFDEGATAETLSLSFGTPLPERVSRGAPATATLTLVDNDTASTINLNAVPATLREGTGIATVEVTAALGGSATLPDDLTILLLLAGATPGTDYTVTGTPSITITAGAMTGRTVLRITPLAASVIDITGTADTLAVNPLRITILDNTAPMAVGTLVDLELAVGASVGEARSVSVGGAFSDANAGDALGDVLSYSADSSMPTRVSVEGTDPLTVTAEAVGTSTITVTATDSGGLSATQTFDVTVIADVAAPMVTAIEIRSVSGADNSYATGETLTVAVLFSEVVEVSGAPQLELTLDSGTMNAVYDSVSGMAVLFTYTVQAGDMDADGLEATALTGGSITAVLGNAASLSTLPVISNAAAHRVDGVAPVVSAVQILSTPRSSSGSAYGAGEQIVVQVSFDDVLTVSGAPTLTLGIESSPGAATLDTGRSGGADLFFVYTVGATDVDSDGLSIADDALVLSGGATVTDAAGNAAVTTLTSTITDAGAHLVDGGQSPPDVTNTAPVVAIDNAVVSYAEHGFSSIAYTATDADSANLTWSVAGVDRALFRLSSPDGLLRFITSPNFEDPQDAGGNNVYNLRVVATDNGSPQLAGELAVTVTVMNVDEEGTVSFSAPVPIMGEELTATTPDDPDGGVTALSWQWQRRAADGSTYDSVDTATAASYTPTALDVGNILRVVASYTDAEGGGKEAMYTASHAVRAAFMEWTEDSSVDLEDAKVFYYALELNLVDSDVANTRRVLDSLVPPDADDAALRALLGAVSATVVADVDAVDITGDGDVTSADAAVFYYALALPGALGDGSSGGDAELRQQILGPLIPGADDQRLQEILRRARSLVR